MKKIIIVPGNTDLNRGDQALIWESVRLVKEVYGPETEIFLIESGNNREDVRLQTWQTAALGFTFLKPVLKHPGRRRAGKKTKTIYYSKWDIVFWGVQAIVDLFVAVLLLSKISFFYFLGKCALTEKERQTLKAFEEADAVYVKGGGFIHSYGKVTDAYLTFYSLFLPLLAFRYRKPVFVLPNSIGPLKNKWSFWLAKKVLKECCFLAVRESISAGFVERELGISCLRYPDLGYYLTSSDIDVSAYLQKWNIPLSSPKVGITLRPYRFPDSLNPEKQYASYISSIVDFVIYLKDNGYYPVFVAHTLGPSAHEDDRVAIRDVICRIPPGLEFGYIHDYNLNCKDVMSLYGSFDVFVGTRFHSVIFAQNMNVPTLAIAYGGNKGEGIMEDLGMEDFVISIEKVSGLELCNLFQKLISQKDIWMNKLSEIRKELAEKREDMLCLLQKSV